MSRYRRHEIRGRLPHGESTFPGPVGVIGQRPVGIQVLEDALTDRLDLSGSVLAAQISQRHLCICPLLRIDLVRNLCHHPRHHSSVIKSDHTLAQRFCGVRESSIYHFTAGSHRRRQRVHCFHPSSGSPRAQPRQRGQHRSRRGTPEFRIRASHNHLPQHRQPCGLQPPRCDLQSVDQTYTILVGKRRQIQFGELIDRRLQI